MTTYQRIKQRVHEIMAPAKTNDSRLSVAVDIALGILVALSSVAVLVELFVDISESFRHALEVFELVTVGIFILEYILKLWTFEFE